GRTRTIGPSPIRAELESPPLAPIAQVDGMFWRREDQRAGLQHMWKRAGIIFRIGSDLGKSDVACRVYKSAEVAVGDRRAVDPEIADAHAVGRRLLRIVIIRPHAENPAGDMNHAAAIFLRLRGGLLFLVRLVRHQRSLSRNELTSINLVVSGKRRG